ncbi:MAG: ABC transporter permease [Bacillota bacterium]
MFNIPVGEVFESIVNWLQMYASGLFDVISLTIDFIVSYTQQGLMVLPALLMIVLVAGIVYYLCGRGVAIFTLFGLLLIYSMGMWEETIQTLAMILTAGIVALGIGIPVGILSAKNEVVNNILRSILDFMQTMPPFVYLIPAVIFFGMGKVPGVIATVIFSMPPAIRLTDLGIRQVDEEVVEAANAFGSTPWQTLYKVQLPLAIPTIMAGVNQTIMLALSMVVIASMIGGGGLGSVVLRGITQLEIGLGFEGGISVVILAIILDRVTQSFNKIQKKV